MGTRRKRCLRLLRGKALPNLRFQTTPLARLKRLPLGCREKMPRVQAIVVREGRVLMVKHRQNGVEWWCLPGGGQEPGETPEQGALRELKEECNVNGTTIRQTSVVSYAPGDEAYSFLVDIADQTPTLGCDPDVATGREVLADVQWLRLSEVPERDRTFLWAAGLLGAGNFLSEVEKWGNRTSYPGEEDPNHPMQATPNGAPDG